MNIPSPSLAAFQSTLLEVLAAGGSVAEMRTKLEGAGDACGLGGYVRSFDDRMLRVASVLVRRWGEKGLAFAADARDARMERRGTAGDQGH